MDIAKWLFTNPAAAALSQRLGAFASEASTPIPGGQNRSTSTLAIPPRKNACNFQITGTGGGRASPPICTFSICASPGAPVPYFAQLIYVAASGGLPNQFFVLQSQELLMAGCFITSARARRLSRSSPMLAFGSDDCQQSTEARYRISVCNEQNQCQPVTALHHTGLSKNETAAL